MTRYTACDALPYSSSITWVRDSGLPAATRQTISRCTDCTGPGSIHNGPRIVGWWGPVFEGIMRGKEGWAVIVNGFWMPVQVWELRSPQRTLL